MIHFGEVGIGPGGRKVIGFRAVALDLHLDGGMVQQEDAGVAVLSGEILLAVQQLQYLRQFPGGAVHGHSLRMGLGVYAYLVLADQVQQVE